MSEPEFSSRARALMESGRGMLNPSDADRARVEDALRLKLGPEALPLAAVSHAAAPFRPSLQLIAGAFAAGAFVAGGVLFFALRSGDPAATPKPMSVAPAASVVSVPSAAEVVPVAPPPDAPAADPAPSPADAPVLASARPSLSSARPAQESLAQEVALLSQATSALHAGQPAEALRLLNEHARKFPNGVLREERRGARAQALCLVGRTSEGQAELARLAPQSPAAARAKQVCSR